MTESLYGAAPSQLETRVRKKSLVTVTARKRKFLLIQLSKSCENRVLNLDCSGRWRLVWRSRPKESSVCLHGVFGKCPDLVSMGGVGLTGGADRDRTDDFRLAKPALSQLSYSPKGNKVTSPDTGAGFLRQVRAPPQARSESYTRSSQRRVEEVSRSWRKKTSRWGTLDSN